MRELEFLPSWYPQIRRRKRMVSLQAWVTLILIVGLGLYFIRVHRDVQQKEGSLDGLQQQLVQTQLQLDQLDEKLSLKRQLEQQDQIIAKLGVHVEAARVLNGIEAAMPPEMAVIEINMDITERNPSDSGLSGAKAKNDGVPVEREMNVRLMGVVPTDVDLANFLTALGSSPYFDEVAMTYAKDRSDSGHVLREFEVNFVVNLAGAD